MPNNKSLQKKKKSNILKTLFPLEKVQWKCILCLFFGKKYTEVKKFETRNLKGAIKFF